MSDLNEHDSVPVNVNTASVEELRDGVLGIGQALAERIVALRSEQGPFATLSELTQVSGIGAGLLDRISSQLTLKEGEPVITATRRVTEPLSEEMLPEDEQADKEMLAGEEPSSDEETSDDDHEPADQPPPRLPQPEVTPLLADTPPAADPAPDNVQADPWLESVEDEDDDVAWDEPIASLAALPDDDEAQKVPDDQEVLITPPPPGQPAPPAPKTEEDEEEPEPWEEPAEAAPEAESVAAQEPAPAKGPQQAAPQAAASAPAAASPAQATTAQPATAPPQRSFWSGVGLALLGGLAGVILTLAVMALWSGTLSFASRHEFEALNRNVSTMQANYEMSWQRLDDLNGRVMSMEGDLRSTSVQVNALLGKVDALEASTAEMAATVDKTQEGINKLAEDLRSLDDVVSSRFSEVETRLDVAEVDIAAASEALNVLGSEVATLREQTEAIASRIERFDSFFGALRDLLIELEGPASDVNASDTATSTEVVEEATTESTPTPETTATPETTESSDSE